MRGGKQELYQGGVGLGVGVNLPGPARPGAAPAADNGIADAAWEFGSRFLGQLAKDYHASQEALIQDKVADVKARFFRFKQEYMLSNKGRDAQSALLDFSTAWRDLSREAIEEFGGRGNEVFEGRLRRELFAGGLGAAKDGGTYQARETKAWQASVFEGMAAEHEALIAADPHDLERLEFSRANLLEAWKRFNPGMDSAAFERELCGRETKQRMEALLAGGEEADLAAAEAILGGAQSAGSGGGPGGGNAGGGIEAGGLPGGLGALSAAEESGKAGVMAIGWDRMGGTSYGKYQISSKQGGMKEWLEQFAAEGGEQKRIADYIGGGGPLDCGGLKGPAARRYKEMAAKYGDMMEASQHKYIMQTHYGRALKGAGEGFKQLVEGDRALQEMVFSTAVQHGGGGAASIFRKVYRPGMDKAELVRAVYARRAQCFGGSSPKVRASAQKRMKRECEAVLRMLGQGGQPAVQAGGGNAGGGIEAGGSQGAYGAKIGSGENPVSVGQISPSELNNQPSAGGQGGGQGPAISPDSLGGLNAAEAARYRARLKQAREALAARAEAAELERNLEDTKGLGREERLARLFDYAAGFADKEKGRKLLALGMEQIKFDSDRQLARDNAEAVEFYRQIESQSLSPLDAMRALEESKLAPDAKDMARKLIQEKGGKESPLNRKALMGGYEAIELGHLKTPDERELFAIKNSLTQEQTRKLLAYKGNKEKITVNQISSLAQAYGVPKEEVTEEVLSLVLKKLGPKANPTEREIQKAVAAVFLEGSQSQGWSGFLGGIFGGQSLREALSEGQMAGWRATVEDHEKPQLARLLEARGIKPTENNMALLKTLNAVNGLHVFKANEITWEK